MIAGFLIGFAIISLGIALFAHAMRVEAAIRGVHQRLGLVPVNWLNGMRRFNIVSLRAVAIFWIAIGGATVILTTIDLLSE